MRYCLLLVVFIITGYYSSAQARVLKKDLRQLVGCWKGTLTCLDYTSGKKYSMPAECIIKQKDIKLLIQTNYPDEPKANSKDTLLLSQKGRTFNGEEVISKQSGDGELLIVTQTTGVDGNDNKAALLKHTYKIEAQKCSIKKEVKFAGSDEWILRNEYLWTRSNCK